ncbi:MAG: FHA domain-containing protein [Myxococcales bacterium]|nr:FHA domain-containing protein [Myxococcales bacterium]
MMPRHTDLPPPPPRRAGVPNDELALWVHAATPGAPDVIALDGRVTLTIGRDEPATESTRDPWMSRVHFRLSVVPKGEPGRGPWLLEDEGSRNGCIVNGRRTPRAVLEPGDIVRAGACVFVLDHGVRLVQDAGLVGRSRGLEQVRAAVRQAARSGGPVYVTGESGAGKEVVARALHAASGRPGAFIAVNMASIVHGVAESQLFGHRRGAFSGAVTDQVGVFDAAHRGTLLLDELGEMELGLQAKLLRTVETTEVHRLGDAQPHLTDVRLVIATHRDLARLVQQGRFREDLYWRLQRTHIEVPPLRARRLDVVPLVLHFLQDAGVPALAELVRLRERTAWHAADLFEHFLLHSWPGNVRELRDEALRLADAMLARMADHASGPIPPLEEILAPRMRQTVVFPGGDSSATQPGMPAMPLPTPADVDRYLALLDDAVGLRAAVRDEADGNIKAFSERVAAVVRRPVAGVRRTIYRTLGASLTSLRAADDSASAAPANPGPVR